MCYLLCHHVTCHHYCRKDLHPAEPEGGWLTAHIIGVLRPFPTDPQFPEEAPIPITLLLRSTVLASPSLRDHNSKMLPSRAWNGWIASYLLPMSSAAVGRLVLDPAHPERDFCDTISSSAGTIEEDPEAGISEVRTESFQNTTSESASRGLSALVTAFLGAKYNIRKEETIDVAAEVCTTRTLTDPRDYFSIACERPAVKEWLRQAWRSRKKVYYIVSVKTLADAKITLRTAKAREMEYSVRVPASIIITAATQGVVVLPDIFDGVLDSEVKASGTETSSLKGGAFIPGEHVYAIQYRRVRFSWLQSPRASNIGLDTENSPATWEVYVGTRGSSSQEDESGEPKTGGELKLTTQLSDETTLDDFSELRGHEVGLLDDENIWLIPWDDSTSSSPENLY